MQELNLEINWIPEFLKEGRVKHNIETAPDWNITRNRYWATAIPIWKSKSGKIKVLGSINELKKYAIKLPKGKIDLHKDYLDKVKLKINKEEYTRIPEVLDCWFESGSMTFAQFHYPFENKEYFEKNFPAQFVTEYIGQTRAWFYYMMALSAILFNKIPFENVLTTGTILAEDGEKMSKSKKNFPDPMVVIKKYGADALRFYLLQSPLMKADNFNFSEKGLEEVYKKVILLLYNVNNFYSLYKIDKKLEKEKLSLIDEWILSRLNQVGIDVEKYLKSYNTIKSCEKIKKFVEDLSTWYVRVNRNRFNSGDEIAKKVLRKVLNKLSKIIAPIMPFVAEKIYENINEKESVHLQKWPKFEDKRINESLNKKMELTREFISLGLKQRDRNKIGLKWPLEKAIIFCKEYDLPRELEEIIKSQLNVKKIELNLDKKIEENYVELDLHLTPELEAEGYAREISRQIQAFRKKLGLDKKDEVEIIIVVDEKFKKILDSQKDFIQNRTNSKKIMIVTTKKETFKKEINFKIKDKRGKIIIVN